MRNYNMRTYDIYNDTRGRLVLRRYNHETKEYDLVKYGDDVTRYLEHARDYSIDDVKEIKTNNTESLLIRYSKFNIRVIDLDKIDKHEQKLSPLINSIKTFYEKKQIEKYKARSSKKSPPKVTRNNKYINQKIAAGLMAGIILTTSAIAAIMSHFKKNSNEELGNNEVAITTDIDDDEHLMNTFDTIVTDAVVEDVVEEEKLGIIIDYVDQSGTNKAIYAKEQYGEVISKYADRYGLDANLMLGIATQERGVHSEERDKGGATGLMQIQNSVWIGNQIKAYNFETGEYDKITVTKEMLSDLDTNVQLGCMIFQNCLGYVNYNIPLAVQTYNYGIGNVRRVVDAYALDTNQTRQDVYNNPCDTGWMDYRDIITVGDSNYLNRVFSWIGENNDISVMKKDGTIVEMNVSNDSVINKVY